MHPTFYPCSHTSPSLHTLVVKQPKCRLVSEAAPLISTSSFCSGPGITPSNLVVSYLLETNQPDQMNYPLCNCLDALRTPAAHKLQRTHKQRRSEAHIYENTFFFKKHILPSWSLSLQYYIIIKLALRDIFSSYLP